MSIKELGSISPNVLIGYKRCHCFAAPQPEAQRNISFISGKSPDGVDILQLLFLKLVAIL